MEFMSALGGSQEDAYRPSLFELVAQEKLKELLQPAVQYLLAVRSIVVYSYCCMLNSNIDLCSKISSSFAESSQQP